MLLKTFLPYIIIFVIGGVAGGSATLGITKAVKPKIEVGCPQPVCPEFKCPEGNNIDFEKVKNFKGTLKVEQHYHIQAAGDSLMVEHLIAEMEKKLNQLKLSRCK